MGTKRKNPLRHVGKTKGNQEIIEYVEYRKISQNREVPFYKIKCHNCDNVYETYYYNFSDKRREGKVCTKCSNITSRKYVRMNTLQAQISMVYSNYKSRSKIKKWEFELSKELFSSLVTSNCHYCNQSPSKVRLDRIKIKRKESTTALLNGIDRIDSNKGYVKDNVLPCCEDCNKAKRNLSYNDFLKMIKDIYKHVIARNH